jgi:hypothetical protein
MPVSVEKLEDGGYLVTGSGAVTGEEIADANDRMYTSPEAIEEIKYQLCDMSGVHDGDVSTDAVRRIVAQDEMAAKHNPGMVMALVANDELVYGLMRMWEGFMSGSAMETMVFKSVEEAEQWLREKGIKS